MTSSAAVKRTATRLLRMSTRTLTYFTTTIDRVDKVRCTRAVPRFLAVQRGPLNGRRRHHSRTVLKTLKMIRLIVRDVRVKRNHAKYERTHVYDTPTFSGFGRPFVKRFELSYRTVVCLSVCLFCLSETLCIMVKRLDECRAVTLPM